MPTTSQDSTWYIAIIKLRVESTYRYLTGAHGEQYRDYVPIAEKNGIQIIAEQFKVSDDTFTKIDMKDREGISLLDKLITEMNAGKINDPQRALTLLCSQT